MARVLVVDDDVFVRMIVAMELPELEVLEAANAADAVRMASSEKPDAIVIDRRLPDRDGLDLVRSLRQTITTSRTPIILITAGHDEADREEVLRAGADDYLAKPFDPPELAARLRRVIELPAAARRPARRMAAERLHRSDGMDLQDPPPADVETVPIGQSAASPRRPWWRRIARS